MMTGYELGYVAWGIGLVVGISVAGLAGQRSMKVGVTAGSLALVGLMCGKLIMMQWGLPSMLMSEWSKNGELVAKAVMYQMLDEKLYSDRVQQVLDRREARNDDRKLPGTIVEMMVKESAAREVGMSEEKKEAVLREYLVEPMFAEMPMVDRAKMVVSYWDGLWALLAMGTAFGVGKGKE